MPRTTFLLAGLALAAAAPPAIAAEVRLEANYSAYFNALEVGRGTLRVEITENGYKASGTGAVTGIVKLLHKGEGSATARGTIVDGKVVPMSYAGRAESGRDTDEVRIELGGGVVRDVTLDPPPSRSRNRIAVTDEHRVNVVDPMSAALMPLPGDHDLSGPAACERTLPIFDGRYRYDLVFNFERTDRSDEMKPYGGSVAVCRVAYRPIAGHNPNRRETKEAVENRNVFVWLAPVADTRVLVPARVSVGTRLGTLAVQATRFSSRRGARADAAAK
jgi:hypothetical protein